MIRISTLASCIWKFAPPPGCFHIDINSSHYKNATSSRERKPNRCFENSRIVVGRSRIEELCGELRYQDWLYISIPRRCSMINDPGSAFSRACTRVTPREHADAFAHHARRPRAMQSGLGCFHLKNPRAVRSMRGTHREAWYSSEVTDPLQL